MDPPESVTLNPDNIFVRDGEAVRDAYLVSSGRNTLDRVYKIS